MTDDQLKGVMKMGIAYTAKQIAESLKVSEDEGRQALELAVVRGWMRGGFGRGRERLEEKFYIRRR